MLIRRYRTLDRCSHWHWRRSNMSRLCWIRKGHTWWYNNRISVLEGEYRRGVGLPRPRWLDARSAGGASPRPYGPRPISPRRMETPTISVLVEGRETCYCYTII